MIMTWMMYVHGNSNELYINDKNINSTDDGEGGMISNETTNGECTDNAHLSNKDVLSLVKSHLIKNRFNLKIKNPKQFSKENQILSIWLVINTIVNNQT